MKLPNDKVSLSLRWGNVVFKAGYNLPYSHPLIGFFLGWGKNNSYVFIIELFFLHRVLRVSLY